MSEVTDAERGLPPHGTSVQSSESPGRQPGRDTLRRLACPLWPPLILFVLCAAAQVVRAAGWVHANFGAFSFLDELLYKRDAESIIQGLPYFSFHYPPLYPLVLSAAFIFRTHWYLAMLLINAVVSSTVIFPVWAISRRFLTTRQSWLVAAVILLLPYGFAYPPVLWSENLFIPLLCLAVYLGFCADLDRPGAGYLYGLTVAALWATRYIAVVLVPVFAGLWFWRTHKREGRGTGLPHKRTMAGFAGGFTSILLPWLLYGLYSSDSLRTILFGSYSLSKTSPSADLASLGFWITSYLGYLVLAAGPVLPWVFLALLESDRRSRESQLLSLAGLIVFALFVPTIHHSWRHDYNYPEPFHLLGRYLTVAMPIIFCVGVVALMRRTEKPDHPAPWRVGLAVAISLGLVFLARATLFGHLLGHLRADFARTSYNSPDTYGRDSWWAIVLILVAASSPLFLLLRRGAARVAIRAVWFSGTALILLSCGIEVAHRTDEHGMVGRHARILARTWRRMSIDRSKRVAFISKIPVSECTANRLAVGGRFFGLPDSARVSNRYDCVAATSDFVIRVSPEPPRAPPLATYTTFGRRYSISLVQSESSSTLPCVLSWGPTTTAAKTAFNVQPDGGAAMWIKGRNFSAETRVRFGDTVIRPRLARPDLLTFRVPRDLYSTSGRIEIRLFQEDSEEMSDPVWFLVTPR